MTEENAAEVGVGLSFPAENLRPCDLTLKLAQQQFVNIMSQLPSEDKKLLLKWVKWNWLNDDADIDTNDDIPDEILKTIANDIRDNLPPDAILPSENIMSPALGEGLNCDPNHSLHVDSFLYDDDAVDTLGDTGKLDRNYCLQCGSHKTQPLNFISHSLSKEQLLYVFTSLLPPIQPDQVLLDIGSRLGAVLYGAFLYSKVGKIVGIEINKDFCTLQRGIINKYGFQDRVEVVEGNIFHRSDILQAANIIIMNNVFECFMTPEQQVEIWKFLRQTIKKDTILVTNPPIDNVFAMRQTFFAISTSLLTIMKIKEKDKIEVLNFHENSKHTGIVLSEWVRELPLYNEDAPGFTENSQTSELKAYQVL